MSQHGYGHSCLVYCIFDYIKQALRDCCNDLPSDELHLVGSLIDLVANPLKRVFSWGIPCYDALLCVKKYAPHGVIDMGCGTGYWGHVLASMGVHVVSVDQNPAKAGEMNLFFLPIMKLKFNAGTNSNLQHALKCTFQYSDGESFFFSGHISSTCIIYVLTSIYRSYWGVGENSMGHAHNDSIAAVHDTVVVLASWSPHAGYASNGGTGTQKVTYK